MPAPTSLASRLTDPATCGEDLAFNLASVSGFAARYCSDCADYHVLFAARRIARSAESVEIDRADIAALVAERVAARRGDAARVLVAGASDTGILATAAHGVATLGPDALEHTQFIVLDRCGTPLALCRAFADRHGLAIETDVVDLTTDVALRTADVVIVHSLFRQLPPATHVETLRRFAQWLRPGGRIVFSHRVEVEGDSDRNPIERAETGARIRQGVLSGELVLGESLETFDARLSRRKVVTSKHLADYRSVDALLALFAAAGLEVRSTKEYVQPPVVPGGPGRQRLLAVLARD